MTEQAKRIPLDSETEVVFNSLSDMQVFGVKDEDTGDTMLEIYGYDLQMRVNRDKIHSADDVENLLDGIKDLFRKLILDDLFGEDK